MVVCTSSRSGKPVPVIAGGALGLVSSNPDHAVGLGVADTDVLFDRVSGLAKGALGSNYSSLAIEDVFNAGVVLGVGTNLDRVGAMASGAVVVATGVCRVGFASGNHDSS